jgi:hypothetical protein
MARSSSAFRRWGPAAGRRPRALARPGNERVQGSARAVVRRALSPLAPRGWWWLGGGGCVRIAVGQTMRTTHADALASRVRNRCPEPSAWRRPPEGRGARNATMECVSRPAAGLVSGVLRCGARNATMLCGLRPAVERSGVWLEGGSRNCADTVGSRPARSPPPGPGTTTAPERTRRRPREWSASLAPTTA